MRSSNRNAQDRKYNYPKQTPAKHRRKIQQKIRRRRVGLLFGGLLIATAAIVSLWARGGAGGTIAVSDALSNMLQGDDVLNAEELRESGVPESLISLYERNPETADFVRDYPTKHENHKEIRINGDLRRGKMPHFLQWDERWGYETYGDDFMAITGCGPTCLSMVYAYLKNDATWNPYNLAKYAEQEGYYVAGSGSSWDMMTTLAREIGLDAEEVIFDEDHIRAELRNGHPIICIMGAGDFTTTGHFIVLVGENADGTIEIRDPNSIVRTEKSWDLRTLMNQTRNLWRYQ